MSVGIHRGPVPRRSRGGELRELAWQALRDHGPMPAAHVAGYIRVPVGDAGRYLTELRAAGRAHFEGPRRGGVWVAVGDVPEAPERMPGLSAQLHRLLLAPPPIPALVGIMGVPQHRIRYTVEHETLDRGAGDASRGALTRAQVAQGVRALAAQMMAHAARLDAWADRAEGVGE